MQVFSDTCDFADIVIEFVVGFSEEESVAFMRAKECAVTAYRDVLGI